jgi:hypothetical protein
MPTKVSVVIRDLKDGKINTKLNFGEAYAKRFRTSAGGRVLV